MIILTKICTKCNIEKAITEFHKNESGKFGVISRCKKCVNKPKELFQDGFKKCTKCKEVKPFYEFNKNKIKKDGLGSWCKNCKNKCQKNYINNRSNLEFDLTKTKTCIKCNEIKLLSEFSKRKDSFDGHTNECKKCSNKYQNKWVNNNPNKIKKIRKKTSKKYRENNPEKVKMDYDRWVKNNPDYQKNRRKNDIGYKIKSNLRSRISKALKGINKSDTTKNLLSCTIEFLKQHIEKQFYKNMTWENYGNYWEADHIIPCSKFDLTKEEEQRKCFHYSNLQPLTKKDNKEKSNNLDWIKK